MDKKYYISERRAKLFHLSLQQAEKAQQLFIETDTNRDGVITPAEFFQLMKKFAKGKTEKMVHRMADMYFTSADKDCSGDLSFDEFLDLYSRLEQLK